MSKNAKIWLIIAASLILIGCIIFTGVMTMLKWDFTKLSTVKFVTNTYQFDKSFSDINIDTDTADIRILPSKDGVCKVICTDEKNLSHSVTMDGETLSIKLTDSRKWYEHIGITFGSKKITVYLPENEYGNLSIDSNTSDIEIENTFTFKDIDIKGSTSDIEVYASATNNIKIKNSTGSVKVKDISAGMLDITVSTGNVSIYDVLCNGDIKIKVSTGKSTLSNIKCLNITSTGNTGDIIMKNVIASELLSIKRSTGDVKFEGCDAEEIFVDTDTGDVSGTLLSNKIFTTSTDTGDIKVPESTSGGKCKINTDTGDIKIQIN